MKFEICFHDDVLFIYFRSISESFATAKLSQRFCTAGRQIAVLSTTITGPVVFLSTSLTSDPQLQYYLNRKTESEYFL